ncbi:MAG: hypothetical protein M3Y56_10970 [Armatimonadota bacterium]|nr:hypothetical protein [Armatimonadota bacterium]
MYTRNISPAGVGTASLTTLFICCSTLIRADAESGIAMHRQTGVTVTKPLIAKPITSFPASAMLPVLIKAARAQNLLRGASFG